MCYVVQGITCLCRALSSVQAFRAVNAILQTEIVSLDRGRDHLGIWCKVCNAPLEWKPIPREGWPPPVHGWVACPVRTSHLATGWSSPHTFARFYNLDVCVRGVWIILCCTNNLLCVHGQLAILLCLECAHRASKSLPILSQKIQRKWGSPLP